MKKFLRPILGCLLFGIIAAGFMESCKTTSLAKTTASNKIKTPLLLIYPMKQQPDTLPRGKQLTPQQAQAFLRPFFQANFEEFVAPEFKRLVGIIEKLSAYQQESRVRMDSIAKERNNYRQEVVSTKDSTLFYQKKIIELAEKINHLTEELLQVKIADKEMEMQRIDDEVKRNRRYIVTFLVCTLIIFSILGVLIFAVRRLSKKLDLYIKPTTHA